MVGALAHIRPRDVDSDDIARLSQVLTPQDKQALRRSIPRAFRLMQPVLTQIASN